MLTLDITHDCVKFLNSLDAKQYRQVVSKLFALLHNPDPQDAARLTGHPFRRVDSGEYRIIYRVEGDVLKVPIIGKRNDDAVYRQLDRRRQ